MSGFVKMVSGNLSFTDGYANVTGDLVINGQAYAILDTTSTPTGTQQTINWNNGNVQVLSLVSATGTVSVDFINPMIGGSYVLIIRQHASAPKNIDWTAACKFAGGTEPTITATNSAIDVISLLYDGTNYYCNIGQNYF